MNELDPDAKALFDVAREALGPPAGAEARIYSKLGVAAGVSLATLAATTSAAGKPVTLLAKLSSAALQLLPTAHALPIAVVAFGGTAVGVWSYAHTEPAAHVAAPTATLSAHSAKRGPRPAFTSQAARVAPAQSAAAPVTPTAIEAAASAAAPVLAAPQRAAPVVASSERVALPALAAAASNAAPPSAAVLPKMAGPRDAQAEAELLLIRQMQAAWRSGNDAQLSAAVAEHRAQFPQGMLSEEREALSAMLACRQSPAQAGAVRARFGERYPRSAYEARVSAACLGTQKLGQ